MLKNNSILKETFSYLFAENKNKPVKVKKVLLDIYTTALLDNNDVGTCLCFGGWGKYRGMLLENIAVHKDLSITQSSRDIVSLFPPEHINSLYLAICSAMSKKPLEKLIRKQANRSMPALNKKGDKVVQIGFMKSAFLDYKSINKLYVFDSGIREGCRSQEARDRYIKIKNENEGISVTFIDELASRQKLLQEADVLIITGSSLANGSLDEILDSCRNAREIALCGRSCAIHPKVVFDKKVTYVYSSIAPSGLMNLAIKNYKKYISLGQPGKEYFLRALN